MTDVAGVRVRPLAAGDLDEADRICRVAFGTVLGAPEPERFFGDAGGLQGVAICHAGAGTEAGSGTCYVKFGAVRPGPGAERLFGLLIDVCHAFAAELGASALVAGANAGRDRAWRVLAGRGFRRSFQGVTMHRPNEPGYSTSGSFVIDDWR